MDEDAKMALGMVLSALGGILERNNICTTMDLANTLGNLAVMTSESGLRYKKRGEYIGEWALMVRAAAIGAGPANQN